MNEQCSTCRYFLKGSVAGARIDLRAGPQGICRRNPPAVNMIPTPQGMAVNAMFPPVKEDMWCGNYEINFKTT